MKNLVLLLCGLLVCGLTIEPLTANSVNELIVVKKKKKKKKAKDDTKEEAAAAVVSTSKESYADGEAIVVNFSGLPGNPKDWINVVDATAPASSYGEWKYTEGKSEGTITFGAASAGTYETRVFFDNGTQIRARHKFTVGGGSTSVATDEPATTESAGATMSKTDYENFVKTRYYAISSLLDDKLESGAGWVHSYFKVSGYLEKAREMDYVATMQKISEHAATYPAVRKYEIKQLTEFKAKYEQFYTATLHGVINELIEQAYGKKATNALEAIKYAEEANTLSEAVLKVIPDNTAAVTLSKDAMAALEKVGGDVFAKVYTSDFHKQNAGKIVFFSKAQAVKAEDAAAVQDGFKAGDFIYAMAYLKGGFKDLTKATNKIKVYTKIFVDGAEKTEHMFVMDWESVKKNDSYLFMEIVPDPATNRHSGPAKFAKVLAEASPRNHTVKVSLSAMTSGGSFVIDLVEGEFKLDCSSGQDQLSAFAAKYRNKMLAQYMMPAAKMSNPALAESMKAALQAENWEDGKKIQRVVITGADWTIYRHAITGVILYRSLPAAVAFKTDSGECKFWNLTFKQAYDGRNYGKTVQGGVGSIVELSCDNVNK